MNTEEFQAIFDAIISKYADCLNNAKEPGDIRAGDVILLMDLLEVVHKYLGGDKTMDEDLAIMVATTIKFVRNERAIEGCYNNILRVKGEL